MNMREFKDCFQEGTADIVKKAAVDKMAAKYTHQLTLKEWKEVLNKSSTIDNEGYRTADIEAKIADRIKNCNNGDISKDIEEGFDKFSKTKVGSGLLSFFDPKYYKKST